jgi:hypothetical protein
MQSQRRPVTTPGWRNGASGNLMHRAFEPQKNLGSVTPDEPSGSQKHLFLGRPGILAELLSKPGSEPSIFTVSLLSVL